MSAPYRAAPTELPPRVEDMLWRRRVAQAATGVFWCLLAQGIIASVLFSQPVAAALAYGGAGVLVALFTWKMTEARPGHRGRFWPKTRGALRGLSLLTVPLAGLAASSLAPYGLLFWLDALIAIALVLTGVAYMRALFLELQHYEQARRSLHALIAFGLFATLYALPTSVGAHWYIAGIASWALLLVVARLGLLLRRLVRALRVKEHTWWYKKGTGWASMALRQNGTVETFQPDGSMTLCASVSEAAGRLHAFGYLPGPVAVTEGHVLAMPPQIAPEITSSQIHIRQESEPTKR